MNSALAPSSARLKKKTKISRNSDFVDKEQNAIPVCLFADLFIVLNQNELFFRKMFHSLRCSKQSECAVVNLSFSEAESCL